MDLVNSLFVFGGAVFTWLNVYRLYVDGHASGISVVSQAFFALWAVWTVVYFLSVGHWISSLMAVIQAIGGILWVYKSAKMKLDNILP